MSFTIYTYKIEEDIDKIKGYRIKKNAEGTNDLEGSLYPGFADLDASKVNLGLKDKVFTAEVLRQWAALLTTEVLSGSTLSELWNNLVTLSTNPQEKLFGSNGTNNGSVMTTSTDTEVNTIPVESRVSYGKTTLGTGNNAKDYYYFGYTNELITRDVKVTNTWYREINFL